MCEECLTACIFCSNVVVKGVTILAPHDSPNTDGVDPGLCHIAHLLVP
jgi:polygalacturonase